MAVGSGSATAQMVLIATFLAVTGQITYGVPQGLLPRQQVPEVTGVLQSISANSQPARDGTWELTTGPGEPGATRLAVTTGFSGDRMYVTSPASPKEYHLLYDGTRFYESNRPTRVCFDLDALESRRWGYASSLLLLHANLRPLQFLACRPLVITGEVSVGGADCVVLRAYAERDAAKTDPYAAKPAPWEECRTIDYFCRKDGRGIAKIVVSFSDGTSLDCTVKSWADYGLAVSLPGEIVHRLYDAARRPISGELITAVSRFSVGDAGRLEEVATAASKQKVFGGIGAFLRRPTQYQVGVRTRPDDLTARMLLAQSSFRASDAVGGLEQWDDLRARSANVAERDAIDGMLVVPAGQAIAFKILRDARQAEAAISVWERVAAASLSPAQWQDVSFTMALAWSHYRNTFRYLDRIAPLEDRFLENVLPNASLSAVCVLLQAAGRDSSRAAKIDPAFDRILQVPLTDGALGKSKQLTLIAGAARIRQLDRASQYANRVIVDEGQPKSAATLALVKRVLRNVGPALSEGRPDQLPDLTADSVELAASAIAMDSLVRAELQALMTRAGASALMSGRGMAASDADFDQWVTLPVDNPDAHTNCIAYWSRVAGLAVGRYPSSVTEADRIYTALDRLAAAIERRFPSAAEADFRAITLARSALGATFNESLFSPDIRIKKLEAAFASSRSDVGRIAALKGIARAEAAIHRYQEAKDTVARLIAELTTPAARADADGILLDLDAQRQAWIEASGIATTANARRVLESRVAYLTRQLEQLEREGRSIEDLESLRAMIAATQADLEKSGS